MIFLFCFLCFVFFQGAVHIFWLLTYWLGAAVTKGVEQCQRLPSLPLSAAVHRRDVLRRLTADACLLQRMLARSMTSFQRVRVDVRVRRGYIREVCGNNALHWWRPAYNFISYTSPMLLRVARLLFHLSKHRMQSRINVRIGYSGILRDWNFAFGINWLRRTVTACL